jgi:Rrf2 family cysteine metabolism transcriptional repressor
MFSLSSKATYGIAAILELAANYGNGLLRLKDIAQKRKIPKHYLVQLFNGLLKAGLLRSVRGNKGGYELNNDPANVSFLQVLEMLEGAIELEISYPENDAAKELFKEAEIEIKKIFDISLAELLLRQQQYDNNVIFHI